MITLLNVSHQNRALALGLLKWIGELGGVSKHDMILQVSQGLRQSETHTELVEEATKHFASVSLIVPCTSDERGWPWSCNHAWMHALQTVREKIQKPWLWLEEDCVPLTSDWLDKIEEEYKKADASKKAFMGAEVLRPSHRMSGIGVYPPMVVSYLTKIRLPDLDQSNFAWDHFLASEIVPHTHFTRLIQNVYLTSKDPDISPTFPTAESLSILDTQAVLFHRCKDSTLIDRLREKLPVSSDDVPMTPKLADDGTRAKAGNDEIAALKAEIERLKATQPQTPRAATATTTQPPVASWAKKKGRKPMSEANKQAARERLALAREKKKQKATA